MSKRDRILGLLPAIYKADERTSVLYEVVGTLAGPLEAADTDLFRIQAAHRIRAAEHPVDIMRLAAALNLTTFHFEDLLTYESLAPSARLDEMRTRVQRVASVHLDGLGTPWAVVESAAIFTNTTIVPQRPGEPLLKRIDEGGFSSVAVVESRHVPGAPRSRIYLHENPLRREKVALAERYPLDSWSVSKGAEPAPATLFVRGIGDRTVSPTIFCPSTGESVTFHGIVPEGATLLLDPAGATMEGRRVDDWVELGKGGHFDHGAWNDSTFDTAVPATRGPFDGVLERLATPPYQAKKPTPTIPVGSSNWYFTVAVGVFDRADADFCVFSTPEERPGTYDTVQFDDAVFDYPASGQAGMAWGERISCAFKLLLPAKLPRRRLGAADAADEAPNGSPGADSPDEAPEEPDWVDLDLGRVTAALPRYHAAGIRAFVDVARESWVLGEGILRAPDATDGAGIDSNQTTPRRRDVDLYVPFEAVPADATPLGGNTNA